MEWKSIAVSVAITIVALILYHKFVSGALGLKAYEAQSYDRLKVAA